MRILTQGLRVVLLTAVIVTVMAPAVSLGRAHPPEHPDHGLNQTTFAPLWAGDEDVSSEKALTERIGTNASALEELAAMTDIGFDQPPAAVEQWNRRSHASLPKTTKSRSSYPADATLSNGRFIRHAHASVFAIQPSTRVAISNARQPLYVAPDGELLGLVDYRVVVPRASHTRDKHVTWKLQSHEISETGLFVDGVLESQTSGTQTPVLTYDSLDSYRGATQTLSIESEITVRLQRRVRTCTERVVVYAPQLPGQNESEGEPIGTECLNWKVRITSPTETVIVSSSREVTVQTFEATGRVAHYPSGSLGVDASVNQPWRSYSTPAGEVKSNWSFYSARTREWDTLRTENGKIPTETHSPAHPLQVHAYPVEPMQDYHQPTNVEVLSTAGEKWSPPSLPETVELDVVTEPYTALSSMVMHLQIQETDISDITVNGVVRGVSTQLQPTRFKTTTLYSSNLSVDVVATQNGTRTVRATLREQASGAPISTQRRAGYIVVGGERTNTSSDGTATVTVSSSNDVLDARYVPGRWWHQESTYIGDTDTTYERTADSSFFIPFYQMGVPIGVLLAAVFLLDRITGWGIWPPWRNL